MNEKVSINIARAEKFYTEAKFLFDGGLYDGMVNRLLCHVYFNTGINGI